MQKTELDDLVVLSWKLTDLGSDKFETYTQNISITNNSLYDSYYLLKTCERIVVAYMCSSLTNLPHLSQCALCSSNKNCLGSDIAVMPSSILIDAKKYTGIEAFRYLSLIASSLDSSTIGEPEILGQFKNAFVSQQKAKTLFGTLNEIIVYAYKAGKKIHNSSGIPKGRISILSNAEKIFNDWVQSLNLSTSKNVSIAIVGTGKMGRDAYKYFKGKNSEIKVYSRNRKEFDTQDTNLIYESYDLFLKELEQKGFNVIILCSSTNEPYIVPEIVQNQTKLLLFDVGIPKNADPTIQDIPGIKLYQMDQLVQLSELNYSKREQALALAYEILDEQVLYVSQVFEKKMINPFIKDLRIDLEKVAKKRLDDYTAKKELPLEFYKWFNNTIKEMMHVSQQHLEKSINETSNSSTDTDTSELKDFQILDDIKSVNEHNAL